MPVQCTCLTCGAVFHKSPSEIAAGKGKFCTKPCHVAARRGAEFSSGLKTCPSCALTLPHEAFFRRTATPSGLSSTCKTCHVAINKAWRERRPGYTTEWARRKYGSPPRTKLPRAEVLRRLRERTKQQYRKDLEASRKRGRERYHLTKESRRAYTRAYVEQNRERRAIASRLWAQRNPLHMRLKNERRRARKTHAQGTFTTSQLHARCAFYGWACYLCNVPLTMKTLTIDHRIPLARQGTNWPANLAPCCRSCNGSKGSKTEREYRDWKATLRHSA